MKKIGKFQVSDRAPKAGDLMVCVNKKSLNYMETSVTNKVLVDNNAIDTKNWKVVENVEELKQELVDEVIENLKKDIKSGDLTVLDELLKFIPNKNLVQSLDEERWSDYKHFNK
jgi:hypothetical protein